MDATIYVVGMASTYPGAGDLKEFWESVLTRRRGFRDIPRQRLELDEYGSPRRDDRDKTYVRRAAVIDGFNFDWKARRVPKAAFEATDPVHWLALTTAERALADAGVDLDAAGRERIGVILGNSLTGEVSRANLLRLRWPYVRRVIAAAAAHTGLATDALAALLGEAERQFKAPFPVPNEDSLAGALSNVIAGRICNVLDLNGGGYVVDGACASSLLAVANACEALAAGRLDMVVAGGVDLSLDPLELVGFARTGALTTGPMRVYDRDSAGFIPGEGCGMLVLTRGSEVERLGLKPWARIAGWGISSDGAGGITAPRAGGQALAMRRCYAHADFGPADLDFIEGHGTGTAVGDRQELLGFLEVTSGASADGPPPDLRRTGLTSVKTLIGHTKAAAGAAGLIKAVLGVNQRVLPPLAGLVNPADAFAAPGARLYPLARGATVAPTAALRAGVCGAGFGGINCHVAVTAADLPRRALGTRDPHWLLASAQDAEVFIASAPDLPGLCVRLAEILESSAGMADGELVDLAAACALRDGAGALRAAVVADTVETLRARLAALMQRLDGAGTELPAAPPGTLLGRARPGLRIGYLFPGQGSQFLGMGSTLAGRAGWAVGRRARWDLSCADLGPPGLTGLIDRPLERADSPAVTAHWESALRDTRVAQPAIVMTSLQWVQWLRQAGITPAAVAGHSLGEIPALVAARLLSEAEAIELVGVRARAAAGGADAGGMLALRCDHPTAAQLVAADPGYAVVANDNAPDQVVLAGAPQALERIGAAARARGIGAVALNVANAFHSRYMDGAAAALADLAARAGEERTAALPFVCGVTGGLAAARLDPYAYLAEQVRAPVRFREAVTTLAGACDLLLEVGPGTALTGLARRTLGEGMAVCALEPEPGPPGVPFCTTLGRLFVAGADLDWQAVYEERYVRPFVPARERTFIENPCARTADLDLPRLPAAPAATADAAAPAPAPAPAPVADDADIEDILRALVAQETGYDLDMIPGDARLARDLNLDSIKIAEVRAELSARGIAVPEDLPLGNTPLRDIARAAVRRPDADRGADRDADREAGAHRAAPAHAPALSRGAGVAAMPRDLPVLGYVRTWRPAALPPAAPRPARALLLHAPERTAEAERLAAALAAVGVTVRRAPVGDDTPAPAAESERLIALPGRRDAAAAVGAFFAALGTCIGTRRAGRPGVDAPAVVLSGGPGLAPVFGFAQSLALELPGLAVLAGEAPADADLLPLALAAAAPGVRLLRLAGDGTVAEPGLARWEPPGVSAIPLAPEDLVVISGGAKGITAECALALLQATRARALLLGTSPEAAPGAEAEATLERIGAAGLRAVYCQCDVTDPAAVRAALARGIARLGGGTIAGLVHGAGLNTPMLATRLDPAVLTREYRVKVEGLANLLAATDPEHLKLCVALGSVIGSLGLAGNSGYALANEALAASLRDLRRTHPHLQVACPAFGIWSEVGMGAKLNVLESLERQHIAALPVAAGTRWFMECCAQPQVPLPLVVAAPMHGLPTWRQARGTGTPTGLPYVDERVVYEPGLVLVSRPSLNPRRDPWLGDHRFRGSLLFPTVQALTAMGLGARLLAGAGRVTEFRDLVISRPIVAAGQGDTPIELDCRATAAGDWDARIGAPGAAWGDPAFAARVALGTPPDAPDAPEAPAAPMTAPPDLDGPPAAPWRAVPAEVGSRLYGPLLFQGPLFQRIEAVLALDLSHAIERRGRFRLRREAAAPTDPVPDPCFLDALLQALQVLVPKDLCLPVGIASTHFYTAAWTAGTTIVEAAITERLPTGYRCRVRAWNAADGAPVADCEGYRVNIIDRFADRPDAQAFLDPLATDRAALAAWLAGRTDLACLGAALGAIEADAQEARRTAAAAQVAAQLGTPAAAVLTWTVDGAPRLLGHPDQGVSIAHDGGRLLSVCGPGRIGCDLQRLGAPGRAWGELLPESRTGLWRDLTGALADRDRAGALVWALQEALVKAGAAAAPLTFAGLQDGAPRFHLTGGQAAAGVLELVLAGRCALALVQFPDQAQVQPVTHYSRAIEMTFKEALPPLKSPTAAVFCAWMGELREEAMSGIRSPLARAFGPGGKGMVTNGTRVWLAGPVSFHTPLRAWVWLERVLQSQPSTFELGFQWAETDAAGTPRRIVAQGTQRLTWVDVGTAGQVRVEPFPDFFADFIAARRPPPGTAPYRPPLGDLPRGGTAAPILWRRGPECGPEHGSARLWLETDEAHSNFVGNIYFSHTASLVERACQKALRQLGTCPCAATLRCVGAMNCKNALRNQGACPGGFFATAFELDHLGEAMPGDTLEALVRLAEVDATSATFDLALANQSHGGLKIAAGRARFCMYAAAFDDPEPQPMPAWLTSPLIQDAA